jgi:alkaline phosphatase
MPTRRSFLSRAGFATVAAGATAAPHVARCADDLLARPGQKPEKIIHLVSDGMSCGTLTCADHYSRLTRGKPLSWLNLYRHPAARLAQMDMRSLNSLVTDSSAASSSWGSGSRVVNGVLNVLPDGRALTPLCPLFAAAGWKTGLVTTAEITHATPAGFAVHADSRGDAEHIATRYLERKIDVLLGGGSPYFSPNHREDKRDLRGEFAKAGYTVVRDLEALCMAPLDTRLLGTFDKGHLPYSIDHQADAKLRATIPTIAAMTEAALARLERSGKFLLQIEGGRIDHAAHNSDAAGAIHDQIALDAALDVCLAFQARHPDTLLVITTDHGNSNLGLNGMGGGYAASSPGFAKLQDVKMSFPEILGLLEKAGETIQVPAIPKHGEGHGKFTASFAMTNALRVDPGKIRDILAAATGYDVPAAKAEQFAAVLAGQLPQMFDQMNPVITQLGQLLANRIGIGWTGNTHTSDYVPLLAIGPGSERFAGFLENTDVFRHFTALAGIDFQNPSVPLLASGPSAWHAEDPARYTARRV